MELSGRKEVTTLEKIWGPLFDNDGHSTVRLGQLLRGLAVHIIEDYTPRRSVVITPTKMARYYENTKLTNEFYPWSTVFDEHSSISRMYRSLRCQHHLIQEQDDQRPNIPGLTPVGFEQWVTLLIRAYPEEEYRRLQKTVLDMPISNPDNRKERFPKEIPQRLFPRYGDRKVRDQIEHSISQHAAVELPQGSSRKEPQPYGNPLFHASNIDERSRSSQNHRHRHVSFVLPDTHRDNRRYLDEPSYRSAERMKRQTNVDVKSYGDSPGLYERTGSDDKPPPRRLNRFTYTNNEDNHR